MPKILDIEKRDPEDIIVTNRARQDVGDVTDLMNAIKSVGQLNPILIDSNNILIAGERRLTAMKNLKKNFIDVRVVDNVSADDKMMIEFLENMYRKDFTWSEDIELKFKMHNFWRDKAQQENLEWGYRATAKKLKCSLGGLSSDLALAEALVIFPELKTQPTKSRAREVYKALGDQALALQRISSLSPEEQENLRKLQNGQADLPIKNTIPEEVTAKTKEASEKVANLKEDIKEPPLSASNIQVTYISENYKKFIHQIPDGSVGMIELDPPYAINYDKNVGEETNKLRTSDDWEEKELYEFYVDYLPVLYNKLVSSGWILCWTGKEHFIRINELASKAGFITQDPGVWMKTGGKSNVPKKKLVSNWEMYLLLGKDGAQFNTASLPSAISIHTVPPGQRIHRWEKPIDLYDHFMKALGKPGVLFLSPFAGSGNCLISAAKAKMIPIGCDKSSKYIPQFYSRLKNYLGIDAKISGL